MLVEHNDIPLARLVSNYPNSPLPLPPETKNSFSPSLPLSSSPSTPPPSPLQHLPTIHIQRPLLIRPLERQQVGYTPRVERGAFGDEDVGECDGGGKDGEEGGGGGGEEEGC